MIWPVSPERARASGQLRRRADLQGDDHLERPVQSRGGLAVSLRQPQRNRVEQDIHHALRPGTGRCGPRGLGRLPYAGTAHVAGPDGGHEGVQVRGAGQGRVDRLQPPGGAEQQRGRVVAAPLVKGDLPAQPLYLRDLQLVQWPGLDRDQQPQGRVQAPGIALGPRRGEQPLRPAAGCGGEQRRPLQERGRRGQAATTLRPARRPLQFRGNVLIRPRRGLGPVPRPDGRDRAADR